MIRKHTHGFTVVEVIVMILILGLLIGISIPALQSLQDHRHQSQCSDNLRQIGAAFRGYAMDHDNQLPLLAAARTFKSEKAPVMDEVLLPYVSSPAVFRCPADHRELYEQSGSSYAWYYSPRYDEKGPIHLDWKSMRFDVIQLQAASKIPVVVDKEAFHRARTHANVLYADGSVRTE